MYDIVCLSSFNLRRSALNVFAFVVRNVPHPFVAVWHHSIRRQDIQDIRYYLGVTMFDRADVVTEEVTARSSTWTRTSERSSLSQFPPNCVRLSLARLVCCFFLTCALCSLWVSMQIKCGREALFFESYDSRCVKSAIAGLMCNIYYSL